MEKEVEVEGKKYKLKEISYIQAINLDGLSKADIAKKLLTFSAGLSEEDMNSLSMKAGMELQKHITEINGLGDNADFQTPASE